ncbi:hypothetical protein CALVIDRAFT_137502 [Calocera viscosa TUFC12733]|uniref:Uncharacterized protein n=1 Tax=Calocera viscosa (strain TUFC12733) TaxID=1330018 RepID=A0A167LZP1_CALVF|nr:hypothetical protein CALVIDRAFT_137502 [Calocera viscosa TUFC12733]
MSSPPKAPALPTLILLSHQSLSPSSSSVPTLQHPEIVYHFLDDPPLALVPGSSSSQQLGASFLSASPLATAGISVEPEKEVLVMDWDPTLVALGQAPAVRSLTPGIAVRGVRMDWEGVPGGPGGREGMVLVDTVGLGGLGGLEKELQGDPAVALQRFAQRNALIRETLDYCPPSAHLSEHGDGEEPADGRAQEGDAVSVSPTSTV